jgi:hypothetical protein
LDDRLKKIQSFKMFGPPDLCYLIKEKKSSSTFTSKTERFGNYHFLFGLECVSLAPIAAYIHQAAQLKVKNAKSSCKVI